MRFIDAHKGRFGVAPICRVLCEHGITIAPSTYYYDAKSRPPSKRSLRDEELKIEIARVHRDNFGVYGPRKVWLQLNREGIEVARCTVERLMQSLGLQGIRRGKKWKTTTPAPAAERPVDLVKRQFNPLRPNALWVADFTYAATWSGVVHVAFVIDAMPVDPGLAWATEMRIQLAREHWSWSAVPSPRRSDHADRAGASHRRLLAIHVERVHRTPRLRRRQRSIGTVGDAFDNALAETVIGLYKSELINPQRPWKSVDQVEIATLHYIDWFNNPRLYEENGDIPPVELEQPTTVNTGTQPGSRIHQTESPEMPGRFKPRLELGSVGSVRDSAVVLPESKVTLRPRGG